MNPNDADTLPPPAAPNDESPAPAAKRRRAPRKRKEEGAPAVEATADDGSPAPVAEAAPPAVVPTAQHDAAPDDAGAAEAGGDAASATGEPAAPAGERSRRGRNRRRGRRGGDRGDRAPRADAGPRPAGPAGDDIDAADADVERDGDEAPAQAATPRPAPVDVGEVFEQVRSGAFDVEPAADEEPVAEVALPTKRVLEAEPDAPKLHKVLAQAGVGSRRDLEQMILEGRITVNGEPAHIGQRISFGDRIAVGGKPVRYRIAPPPPRVLAYHKPAGEVVTHDDPQQRPTVFRRLPRLQQGKWQSVGRLDINTEGLLLFTNSGELANQLMHPRFGVEREYAVRSLGVLGEEAKAKLLEGVDIDGQRCAFKSIEDGGGEGANHWYRCVITEGRNREVRKLFEAVGHAVSRLIRIRYGSVVLPRGLKRGVWVDLDDHDVRSLRQLAGGDRGSPPREGPRVDGDRAGRNNRRGGKRARPGPGERLPPAERAESREGGAIPNPLQQTFDKRAIQQERALRRDMPEDGPIPNPLQQTYDKRALQRDRAPRHDPGEDGPIPNPLQQTYDKRFVSPQKARGTGTGGARGGRKGGGSDTRQPDPLKTAVGYIGGDAFLRKAAGGGRGGRSGGGKRGGGGGGGGSGAAAAASAGARS